MCSPSKVRRAEAPKGVCGKAGGCSAAVMRAMAGGRAPRTSHLPIPLSACAPAAPNRISLPASPADAEMEVRQPPVPGLQQPAAAKRRQPVVGRPLCVTCPASSLMAARCRPQSAGDLRDQ